MHGANFTVLGTPGTSGYFYMWAYGAVSLFRLPSEILSRIYGYTFQAPTIACPLATFYDAMSCIIEGSGTVSGKIVMPNNRTLGLECISNKRVLINIRGNLF